MNLVRASQWVRAAGRQGRTQGEGDGVRRWTQEGAVLNEFPQRRTWQTGIGSRLHGTVDDLVHDVAVFFLPASC